MEQVFRRRVSQAPFSLVLVAWFAVTALFVATVGLYAVIASGIGQRARALGLRLALGATQCGMLRMTLGEGLRLVLVGIGLGFLATFAMNKLISTQLYAVSARDPVSLILVTLLLAVASLFACWVAARRAMDVDPAVAPGAD